MIVDTSALIAILRNEPEAAVFAAAIEIDLAGNPVVSRRFDDLLNEAAFVIEPVTPAQARVARDAYRDFGRGSGHPARLNFGDCFAYALARTSGEPLLFKGDDFVHTDIAPAVR